MGSNRVAIVGAGPCGAIALDSFLRAGYKDIVVFERNKVVGGTWNLDEQIGFKNNEPVPGINESDSDIDKQIPIPLEALSAETPIKVKHEDHGPRFNASTLYPQVETNVLAELMSFSERPLPAKHPRETFERFGVEDAFRTHDVIREYVVDLFKGREHYVKLRTFVEKAWQPDGLGGRWKLVLRHETGGEEDEWYSEEFDFLFVATGRFSVPNIPDIEGLREAVKLAPEGSIIHAKTFRDPELYKDKKVLIVGSGFSNVDLVHLVQRAGARLPVHLSLRSILAFTIPGFAQPWIKPHSTIKKITVKTSGRLNVLFEDDERLDEVDVILLGTGYRYSYPFLAHYVGKYDGGIVAPGGRRTKNLYWSTWWKHDPSLAITANITDSVFWRFIEHQGKASAGLWKRDRSEWPTVELGNVWENARNAKGLKDFHLWWPYFDDLFTELANWGQYDPGDVSIYKPLFDKGFELKMRYWSSLATDWLKIHPEDQAAYDATLAFLEARTVTKVGL